MFQCDIDVVNLNDVELLQHEKELYEMWVRYTTKSTTGAAFGAITAWVSLGASTVLSGPIVGRNVYLANYYSKQSALCSEEVRGRGLTPLATSYRKLTAYCLATLTFGGICAAIPFLDGVEESASHLIDFVVEPCDAAVKAVVNQLEQVFDGLGEAEEITAENSTSDIVEILDGHNLQVNNAPEPNHSELREREG